MRRSSPLLIAALIAAAQHEYPSIIEAPVVLGTDRVEVPFVEAVALHGAEGSRCAAVVAPLVLVLPLGDQTPGEAAVLESDGGFSRSAGALGLIAVFVLIGVGNPFQAGQLQLMSQQLTSCQQARAAT